MTWELLGSGVCLFGVSAASADVVNLTSAFTSGTVNGATYSTDSAHAAGGSAYCQFLLDNPKSSGGDNPFPTLADVRIYTSETTHTEMNLAELNYDLDLQLQGTEGASGTGDMSIPVPVSFFGGDGPDTYVYLHSYSADPWHAGGGFGEWRTPTVIPLPPAVWPAMAALGVLIGFNLARHRSLRSSL
jgi:hypothetical protein